MILIVILGILILIVGHEFGHFISAKLLKMKVEEFGVGLPPKIFGKKKGDTLYSINALPLGGFVRIYGESEPQAEDNEAFLNKPFWQKTIVVLSGIVMNFVLAWIFFSLVLMIGMPNHLMVSQVIQNSPAYEAGIKSGDVIQKITIGNVTLTDPIDPEAFVNLVKNSPEKNVSLEITRKNEKLSIELKKKEVYSSESGYLGIAVAQIGTTQENFFAALWHGMQESVDLVILMFQTLIALLIGIFHHQNALSGLSGPLGIVAFASQSSFLGVSYLFQILGLVSINLAVINILPIPAFDGGRFLFFLIEKIKGKKISFKIQNAMIGVSFVLLLILMVFVTLQDIKNFL